MKIAIANSQIPERLCRMLLMVPGYQIAWIAHDGREAVARCVSDPPDLVLLDPDISGGDGVETTRRIMEESPCAILLVTTTVDGNAAKVFEAMRYGALDAVNTPQIGEEPQAKYTREVFLKKIRTLAKLQKLSPHLVRTRLAENGATAPPSVPLLVAIGSSTGGPKSVVQILEGLPATFDGIIVIVQHVDVEFSAGLADWLDAQTALPVRLAVVGDRPKPGFVYVAGTNDHLVLTSRLRFAYTPEPVELPFRPSVDVFFNSLAQYWPDKGEAILLTGMGRDGAKGLARLRQVGWHTIAQDEATSVVYGMPKAAKQLDAAVEILPLDQIGPAILKFVLHKSIRHK